MINTDIREKISDKKKPVLTSTGSIKIDGKEVDPNRTRNDGLDVTTELTSSGALIINLTRSYTIQIDAWHEGLAAWALLRGSKQELGVDAQLQLLNYGYMVEDCPNYHTFVNTIPEQIRQQIKPFRVNQLLMLQWIAQDVRAEDLAMHNPLLLYLILEKHRHRYWLEPQSKKILSNKQHEILGCLKYSAKKSSIRWLKSLNQAVWDAETLRNIQLCLSSEPVIARLRKLPNGTPAIGNILVNIPALLGTDIPEHIDHTRSYDALLREFEMAKMYFEDTARMIRFMSMPNIERRITQCKSIDDLRQIHDQMSERYNNRHIDLSVNEIFPCGPLREDEFIQQIRSTYELFEEGKEMHHCVGSYVDIAKEGGYFFYRILAPERLTMQIQIRNATVTVVQCKGYCNNKPHKDSVDFLKQWLLENGGQQKVLFAHNF